VLAWCNRNNIAYICPTEVLLEDMQRTLRARRVCLPGSAEEARSRERMIAAASPPPGFGFAPLKDAAEKDDVAVLPEMERLGLGEERGLFRSRLNGSAASPRSEMQRLFNGQQIA
jgi:hypothetical protein